MKLASIGKSEKGEGLLSSATDDILYVQVVSPLVRVKGWLVVNSQ